MFRHQHILKSDWTTTSPIFRPPAPPGHAPPPRRPLSRRSARVGRRAQLPADCSAGVFAGTSGWQSRWWWWFDFGQIPAGFVWENRNPKPCLLPFQKKGLSGFDFPFIQFSELMILNPLDDKLKSPDKSRFYWELVRSPPDPSSVTWLKLLE